MSWVGIQSSGIEFTFIEQAPAGGSASLSGSVASTDSGTPPSGATSAYWQIAFADTEGRAALQLRVTAQSYADSGDSAFPNQMAITDSSGDVVGDMVENTGGASAWTPTPMLFDVVFGSGERRLTNSPDGEFSAQTSAFLIEVWVADVPVPTGGRHIPQKKTLYMVEGETRIVSQEWAGECEERNATVVSSAWSSTDPMGVIASDQLSGTKATAVYTPSQHRQILRNTVTLSNGETLVAWRYVEVQRYG